MKTARQYQQYLFARLATAALSITGVVLATGCQKIQSKTDSASSSAAAFAEPAPDAATQLRNWPVVVATYSDGGTEAGWLPYRYEATPDQKPSRYIVADGATFASNWATSPYTIYKNRNRRSEVSEGVVLAPSSTLVQPIPASTPAVAPVGPAEDATTIPVPPLTGELVQPTPATPPTP